MRLSGIQKRAISHEVLQDTDPLNEFEDDTLQLLLHLPGVND